MTAKRFPDADPAAPDLVRCPALDLHFTPGACALRQVVHEANGDATFKPCGTGKCETGAAVIVELGADAPQKKKLVPCGKHPHRKHTIACAGCNRADRERSATLEAAAPGYSEPAVDGQDLARDRFAGRCWSHAGAPDAAPGCERCEAQRERYERHIAE